MYGDEYRDQQFWEMVVVAAVASGKRDEVCAVAMADELLRQRIKRFPPVKREE